MKNVCVSFDTSEFRKRLPLKCLENVSLLERIWNKQFNGKMNKILPLFCEATETQTKVVLDGESECSKYIIPATRVS